LPQGRVHALWTLDGLSALTDSEIQQALHDPVPEVREQALRLSEKRLHSSRELQTAVASLADDVSPHVRFQLAFTLGEIDTPASVTALAKIARRDVEDEWTQSAVLSSASHTAPALLEQLVQDRSLITSPNPSRLRFLTRLASLVAARGDDQLLARALRLLAGA